MNDHGSTVPIVIPAYKPGEPLLALVHSLLERGVDGIVVINDGSGPEFDWPFERISHLDGVHIVHHAVNLGKGAALKTGMNYALVYFPDCCGVVTADADGQHHPDDIVHVAKRLRGNPGFSHFRSSFILRACPLAEPIWQQLYPRTHAFDVRPEAC